MIRISLFVAATLALGNSMAVAQSPGTFRQAHAVGSGSASDLDPISKGRVFEITDKIMSRLVRADMDGKPAPDLALSWSANPTATEWTFRDRKSTRLNSSHVSESRMPSSA